MQVQRVVASVNVLLRSRDDLWTMALVAEVAEQVEKAHEARQLPLDTTSLLLCAHDVALVEEHSYSKPLTDEVVQGAGAVAIKHPYSWVWLLEQAILHMRQAKHQRMLGAAACIITGPRSTPSGLALIGNLLVRIAFDGSWWACTRASEMTEADLVAQIIRVEADGRGGWDGRPDVTVHIVVNSNSGRLPTITVSRTCPPPHTKPFSVKKIHAFVAQSLSHPARSVTAVRASWRLSAEEAKQELDEEQQLEAWPSSLEERRLAPWRWTCRNPQTPQHAIHVLRIVATNVPATPACGFILTETAGDADRRVLVWLSPCRERSPRLVWVVDPAHDWVLCVPIEGGVELTALQRDPWSAFDDLPPPADGLYTTVFLGPPSAQVSLKSAILVQQGRTVLSVLADGPRAISVWLNRDGVLYDFPVAAWVADDDVQLQAEELDLAAVVSRAALGAFDNEARVQVLGVYFVPHELGGAPSVGMCRRLHQHCCDRPTSHLVSELLVGGQIRAQWWASTAERIRIVAEKMSFCIPPCFRRAALGCCRTHGGDATPRWRICSSSCAST